MGALLLKVVRNGKTDFWTFVRLLSLDVRAVFIRLLNLVLQLF